MAAAPRTSASTRRNEASAAQRESLQRFGKVFEEGPLGMAVAGLDRRLVEVNQQLCKMLGYTRKELTALTFPEFTHPEDVDTDVELYTRLFRGEIPSYQIEKRYIRKNGETIWTQLTVSMLHDEDGSPMYGLGMVEDITDRKRAEEALLASDDRFRNQYRNLPLPTYTWQRRGQDFVLIDHNEAAGAATQGAIARLLSKTANELYQDSPDILEDFARCYAQRTTVRREMQYQLRSTGDKRWVDAAYVFVPPDLVLVHTIDITERKRAEEETNLLQTVTQAIIEAEDFEEALQIVLRSICETKGWDYGEVWVPRPDGETLICSPAWYSKSNALERFRQVSEGLIWPRGFGLPGRVWSSKVAEWLEDASTVQQTQFVRAQPAVRAGLKATLGVPVTVCEEVVAVLLFFRFTPAKENKRQVELISAFATHLGALLRRKRAEEALRESEEQFRALYTKTPAMVHSIDTDSNLVTVSDRWLEVLGYERNEVIGRKFIEFLTAESRQYAETVVLPKFWKIGKVRDVAYQYVKKDGEIVDVLLSAFVERDLEGNVIRTLAVLDDITERKQAEEALREAREELEGRVERKLLLKKNPYRLTFREFTVLHHVAAGKADKDIAHELGISPLTIHKHVANILSKMDAASRTEAAARALREGLVA